MLGGMILYFGKVCFGFVIFVESGGELFLEKEEGWTGRRGWVGLGKEFRNRTLQFAFGATNRADGKSGLL